jgi:hypothetical protein|nr:MAG TPA: hypothetical protein [Caudoviricetes sp.]
MTINKVKSAKDTILSMLLAIVGMLLLVIAASTNGNGSNGMEIVAPLNIKMDVAAIVSHLDCKKDVTKKFAFANPNITITALDGNENVVVMMDNKTGEMKLGLKIVPMSARNNRNPYRFYKMHFSDTVVNDSGSIMLQASKALILSNK